MDVDGEEERPEFIVVEERKGEVTPFDEFKLERKFVDERNPPEDRKSVEDLILGEGGDTEEDEVRKEDGGRVNDALRGILDAEERKGDGESVAEVRNGDGGIVAEVRKGDGIVEEEEGDGIVVVVDCDVEENRVEDRGELGEGDVWLEEEMDVVVVIVVVVVETRHVLEEVRVMGEGCAEDVILGDGEEDCEELSCLDTMYVEGEGRFVCFVATGGVLSGSA